MPQFLYRISLQPLVILFLIVFCICLSSSPAQSQGIERIEASSWNPVGSGARALGMGGAFIAVADDATAASWNPGGLIQLERPEVSIVGSYYKRIEDNSFGQNPEASGQQDFANTDLNYFSVAYPFNWGGRNMIVSLNYQNLYNFTREWQFPFNYTEGAWDTRQNVDYSSDGSLGAIGLAYSIQITPALSLGVTFNFWNDGLFDNGWEQRTSATGSGTLGGLPVTTTASSYDRYTMNGFNANLGVLWNIGSRLTLGAVFKTPFRADLKHEYWTYYRQEGAGAIEIPAEKQTEDLKVDLPMSYGIGLAYRFSDSFTMSFDAYRTEWDDFVLYTPDGGKQSPITGAPIGEVHLEPTTQLRAGAEYLLIKNNYVIPLRGGTFFDPAPAEGSPDYYYGLSAGTGIAYGRYVFDIAYQYRLANNATEFVLESTDFSQDVEEHTIYASLIIHF